MSVRSRTSSACSDVIKPPNKDVKELISQLPECSPLAIGNWPMVHSKNVNSTKLQCIEFIRLLNSETARYASLVWSLGCDVDGQPLREELSRCRHELYRLTLGCRIRLLVNLKRQSGQDMTSASGKEVTFDNLWNLFIVCVDMIVVQLQRTCSLLQCFQIHPASRASIRTGVQEFQRKPQLKEPCTAITLDPPSYVVNSTLTEDEILSLLQSEINTLQVISEDCLRQVEISPWEIQAQLHNADELKTLNSSATDKPSSGELVSIYSHPQHTRRKRICVGIVGSIASAIFLVVLTVCILVLS